MKDILNPWVIAGTILIASVLILVTFLASGWLTPAPPTSYQGGGVITVIPVPTATPTPVPTPTEIPAQSPTPNEEGRIRVGSTIEIAGTGGDGLRLRQDPSLNGEIAFLGLEGEIFNVVGGPEQRDGYLWWQLEAPLNPERQGWAVSTYLESTQSQ
jgi:hypothetical protein